MLNMEFNKRYMCVLLTLCTNKVVVMMIPYVHHAIYTGDDRIIATAS